MSSISTVHALLRRRVVCRKQKYLFACRTWWCCNQAPQGWQLIHLAFPWLVLLLLCISCISVAGQNVLRTGAQCLQPCHSLMKHVIMVSNQESSDARSADCDFDGRRDLAPDKSGFKVETLLTLELFLDKVDFDLVSSKLWGWNYVCELFLRMYPTVDSFGGVAEDIIAVDILDNDVLSSFKWDSGTLSLAFQKYIILLNRQICTLFIPKAHFSTATCQELVICQDWILLVPIAYSPYLIGKAVGKILVQTPACKLFLSDLVVMSDAACLPTLSYFDAFGELMFLKEVYAQVESTRSSNARGLKVIPAVDCADAYKSSTVVMTICVINDGELLVRFVCPKICRNSLHICEEKALKCQQLSVASAFKAVARFSFFQCEISKNPEKQNGWVMALLVREHVAVCLSEKLTSTSGLQNLVMSLNCYKCRNFGACQLHLSSRALCHEVVELQHSHVKASCSACTVQVAKEGCAADEHWHFGCVISLMEGASFGHNMSCAQGKKDEMIHGFVGSVEGSLPDSHEDGRYHTMILLDVGGIAESNLRSNVSCTICNPHASKANNNDDTPLKAALQDGFIPRPSPDPRHRKVAIKVLLLILFSLLLMLWKQEKQVAAYARQQESCHYTFLPFSHLGSRSMEDPTTLSNLELAFAAAAADSLACQPHQLYEKRISLVIARVTGSLGSLLQWFFDSEATIVKDVRVGSFGSLFHWFFDSQPMVNDVRARISGNPLTRSEQDSDPSDIIHITTTAAAPTTNTTTTLKHDTETSTQVCHARSSRVSLKRLEVGTPLLVGLSSLGPSAVTDDVQCESVAIENHSDQTKFSHTSCSEEDHLKEKKEKAKRRKRRSHIVDLKQESRRTGQSGKSSPPSPAMPLAYSRLSPFLGSESSLRSVKGSSGLRRYSFQDYRSGSFDTDLDSKTLSPPDVCVHSSASKGQSLNLQCWGSAASKEPVSTKALASAKTEIVQKGTVWKEGDVYKSHVCKNWAAVARGDKGTPSARPSPAMSSSNTSVTKDGPRKKAVLFPSATFPPSGRSMQWNPPFLVARSIALTDPMSGPSLVSTSLVPPSARAPGTRPAKPCLENNLPEAAVDDNINARTLEGPNGCDLVYDIWGDHFAEVSRRTQTLTCSSIAMPAESGNAIANGSFSPQTPGSLFAASDMRIATSASNGFGHFVAGNPASFSIFSCDALCNPQHYGDTALNQPCRDF